MGAANLRLPSEIVEEILALLPQQSIHRFRSVSKSWSSLLVSVEFHRLRSRSSPPEINVQKLLHLYLESHANYATYHYVLQSLDFRNGQRKNDEVCFPTSRDFLRFVGSCNGLVCVAQYEGHYRHIRGIAVWNPFTGVYRELPEPEYTRGPDRYGFGHVSVSNDYSAVPIAYGFGHDSVGDDYKVFLAVHFPYTVIPAFHPPVVQIFSLKTGSWKIFKKHGRYTHLLQQGGRGLYLNGALHWENRNGKQIVAFDLAEEKFSAVRAPVVDPSYYRHVSMGIVGEYLCMCWRHRPIYGEKVVWVMKEHGNWVPFIQYIKSGVYGSAFVGYECDFIPPAVKDRGYMMLSFRLFPTEILQWNNNHGEAGVVDQGGRKHCNFYHEDSSIPYTEALTSPYPTASELCLPPKGKPTKKEMAHDHASAQPKRGYQSSTVRSSINDLDEFLLTEILKRLPSAREATALPVTIQEFVLSNI
ncbi:hypothetical protein Tsubulata_031261 [Turnera subulata]|uniref:F-box domain-containing protein n=1 Tax=Turnera subulata TaxID=218843 RepID=A0A9Q0GCH4_9ROSI|nr:hypothetical protein Tsubulata_031261 [Turnera subulata]